MTSPLISRRRLVTLPLMAGGLALAPQFANAQAYPSKPIKIVVPRLPAAAPICWHVPSVNGCRPHGASRW